MSATRQPRSPILPPLLPTNTLLPTTNGALLIVSPCSTSPNFVRHTFLPVLTSIAMVWVVE